MNVFLKGDYMKNLKSIFICLTYLTIISISWVNSSTITFYTDQSAWSSELSDVETFTTTRSNVEKSNEVTSPLSGNNLIVGASGVLTWQASNTGFSRDFRFTATTESEIVFNDNETSRGNTIAPYAGYADALSVGDIVNLINDDWQFEILSGPDTYAFGFYLGDNDSQPGESLKVYSQGSTLIGTLNYSNIPSSTGTFAFIGMISDAPIAKVEFLSEGDDLAVKDFLFAGAQVPEPGTYMLIFLSLGIFTIIRKNKS